MSIRTYSFWNQLNLQKELNLLENSHLNFHQIVKEEKTSRKQFKVKEKILASQV